MGGWRLVVAAVAVCVAAPSLVGFIRRADHAFLVPRGGAEWILASRPFRLVDRKRAMETVGFRHRFEKPEQAADARLHVQALRSLRLFVNGRPAGAVAAEQSPWRNAHTFDLAPYLVPGTNEVRIDVENDRGPPVLLAWSPGLGLATSAEWESRGDALWQRSMTAAEARHHPVSEEFPSAWRGLMSMWELLIAAFALGAGASVLQSRWLASRPASRLRLRPEHVRWLVDAALVVLVLHNLTALNIKAGFDADFHFEYIRYVAAARRVPLAHEGWQFFQPPLFYLIAAVPYLLITVLTSELAAMLAMRLLVLICGIALVEMVYRGARAAFPQRDDLQMIATATGGFLPMTVYMSHYVSNEPLAAALTAALVACAFRLLADPTLRIERWVLLLGSLFGLALLAKVTVVLLLPLLVLLLAYASHRRGLGARHTLESLTRFSVVSGIVAGWYFVRNWVELGTPYLAGWDPARGGAWNQDPGYRVPQDLLTFGQVLRQPVYAGISSIWDGIYSTFWLDGFLGSATSYIGAPPWSHHHAAACALLALPLTALGVAGALRSLRIPRNATEQAAFLSAMAVFVYLGALFSLYLWLPIFSTVKSTYTMGLAPCYGVLFAWGADLLPRRPAVRAALAGYLTAWLAFVFRTYFN